jgi:hypothetical protein
MKKITLLCLLFTIKMTVLPAQLKLPEGYAVANDVNDSVLILKADFNGDKIKDQFAVIEKEGNAKLIALISKGGKQYRTLTHKSLDFFDCCSSLSFEKNILTVTSRGMRYFEYYKFRYNKKMLTFELIGYDTESFGNAIHDGAGTESVNLLSGVYEYSVYTATNETDGTTKSDTIKITVPKKFTLANFDEAYEFLHALRTE